jgi:hypothetical protein
MACVFDLPLTELSTSNLPQDNADTPTAICVPGPSTSHNLMGLHSLLQRYLNRFL